MRADEREAFGRLLTQMDRWLHCAIYLGLVAQELGLATKELDEALRASPVEISKMLVEKMDGSLDA